MNAAAGLWNLVLYVSDPDSMLSLGFAAANLIAAGYCLGHYWLFIRQVKALEKTGRL